MPDFCSPGMGSLFLILNQVLNTVFIILTCICKKTKEMWGMMTKWRENLLSLVATFDNLPAFTG